MIISKVHLNVTFFLYAVKFPFNLRIELNLLSFLQYNLPIRIQVQILRLGPSLAGSSTTLNSRHIPVFGA
jgi:hypothetical protein